MSARLQRLDKVFASCLNEGVSTLHKVLLAEVAETRAIIVEDAKWKGSERVAAADRVLEAFKSYLAGETSLEDCLWLRTHLDKKLSVEDVVVSAIERAVRFYQQACTELPLTGDLLEGARLAADDLLCFNYLWSPKVSNKTHEQRQLVRLKTTLKRSVQHAKTTASSEGTRLRNSLLAS